jgi:Rrf2 family protein
LFSLSQTSGYAIQALACLARCEGDWHQANQIAECSGVPKPYLAKILHALSGKGLVVTKRGYRGGYGLARPAGQINLLDIVRAIDDPLVEERCMLGIPHCSDERACPVHDFWKERRSEIVRHLESITLDDLTKFEDFRVWVDGSKENGSKRAPARDGNRRQGGDA